MKYKVGGVEKLFIKCELDVMIVTPEMDFRGSKGDLYEGGYFGYFKFGIYLILTLLNSSFSVTVVGKYKKRFLFFLRRF